MVRYEDETKSDYVIQQATPVETKLIWSWASDEGWNSTWEEYEALQEVEPTAFLVGISNKAETQEVVSGISANVSANRQGHIGNYLVKPGHRNQGFGHPIFKHALYNYLLAGPNKCDGVSLDSVLAQVSSYEKHGFKTAWESSVFFGKRGSLTDSLRFMGTDPNIKSLSDVREKDLLNYDRLVSGIVRPIFWKVWKKVHSPPNKGYAVVYRSGGCVHGPIRGIGAIRPVTNGYRIGPLFAEDTQIAKSLLSNLVSQVEEGIDIRIDVCKANSSAVSLVKDEFGWDDSIPGRTFSCMRMWLGTKPKVNIRSLYGISSFEYGG